MPSPELLAWVALAVLVPGMLALDLFVRRDAHEIGLREAAAWSVAWILLGLGFGAVVAVSRGADAGGAYLAGYLIEKSLSMDNVFLFAMIFGHFAVPPRYQHRVLFWGVIGAIVFRAVFIVAGAALLDAVHWLIYVLGAVLLLTGVRMWRSGGHAMDPSRSRALALLRRVLPVTTDYRGDRFLVREAGRLVATPLLAVLVVVESSDVLFAIDSIPAIFAITTDPFIVFTSNLFAMLGLRSLYFLLAGLVDRFVYLRQGLAALLVFAGAKILLAEAWKMPVALSLGAVVTILAASILASLWATRGGRTVPAVGSH